MQKNPLIKRLTTRFLEGLILAFSFLLILGIAFAFSTWTPGQPPQGSPANGNIQLAACPVCPSCPDGYYLNTTTNKCVEADISGHSYGYCSSTNITSCVPGGGPRGTGSTCRNSGTCDLSSLVTPANCATYSSCGCLAGYTLKLTGTASGVEGISWTTSYYTCIKN